MERQLKEQGLLKPESIQLHIEGFSLIFEESELCRVVLPLNLTANMLDFFGSNAVDGYCYSPLFHHQGEVKVGRNTTGNQKSDQALGTVEADPEAWLQMESEKPVQTRPAVGLNICCGFTVKHVIT